MSVLRLVGGLGIFVLVAFTMAWCVNVVMDRERSRDHQRG